MPPNGLEREDGEQVPAPQERVANALAAAGFDDEAHPTVEEYRGQLTDALREGGTAVADVLDQMAAAAQTDEEQALVGKLREQLAATAPETVETTGGSIDQLTEQIKSYNGGRAGLAALVRELGAANVDNPGTIDGTPSGSISAERAARAVEEGNGMNVSMPEIQRAATRVYLAEEQAATSEQPPAPETVKTTGESGAESSAEADGQKAPPAGGAPSGVETVASGAEPAATDEEPPAEAENPETAAVESKAPVEVDSGGGDGESAAGDGAAEAQPSGEDGAEGLEEHHLHPDETLDVAMKHDQLPRENTFRKTLADATEGVSDEEAATAAREKLMGGVEKVLQRPHASLAEQLVAARQLQELGAELPAEKSIDALQEKMLDSVREQLAGYTSEELNSTIRALRDMAEAMPETYATLAEQLADDQTFQSVEQDLGKLITEKIDEKISTSERNRENGSSELPVYDDRVNELMTDYRRLFGKDYEHQNPETQERVDSERKEKWQQRREKIMSGKDLAVPGGAFGRSPERGLKDFIGNFLLEIADDAELQSRLQEAIDAMRKRWVLNSGNLAITEAQVGAKTRHLDQAAQLLEEANAKATTS